MPPTATPVQISSPPPSRQSASSPKLPSKLAVYFLAIVLAGVGSGYLLSRTGRASSGEEAAPGVTQTNGEIGVQDENLSRDCAQGILEANDPADKNTEGSHHLIREGGPSKTLHMTSSVLALDDYVGKKVEVCGETLDSKRVAWFMDVVRLKLLQ